MITEKRNSLEALIESENQVHLTVYLVNRGDLADMKRQIKESLVEARESLDPVFSQDEQRAFLRPIEALLDDARRLKGMKGNVGICTAIGTLLRFRCSLRGWILLVA
jgi:hypothetical protein